VIRNTVGLKTLQLATCLTTTVGLMIKVLRAGRSNSRA